MTRPDHTAFAQLLRLSAQKGALPDACPISALGKRKKGLADQGLLAQARLDMGMRRRTGTLGPVQSLKVYRLAAAWTGGRGFSGCVQGPGIPEVGTFFGLQ